MSNINNEGMFADKAWSDRIEQAIIRARNADRAKAVREIACNIMAVNAGDYRGNEVLTVASKSSVLTACRIYDAVHSVKIEDVK